MDEVTVDLKLSAPRTGSRTNPRLVWSVGVEKEFLENVPVDQQKVQLESQDGQLVMQLGSEGVKLSQTVKGNFAWASAIGANNVKGMKTPDDEMPAQTLKGSFNPKSNRITFRGELPQIVLNSFMDMDAARKEADPETHFPGTHFVEDIREEIAAAEHDLDSPEGALAWFNNRVKMGSKSMHTEQATLTPALANVLIDHNAGNRPIRLAKLSQYEDDIRQGRWQLNGETIIISKEGLMNNGQHRSHAVIETETAIPVLFVFGVERDSRKTVDTGANRGPHDQLSADGYAQPTTMAAVARFVLSFERNEGKGFANLNRISGQDVYERAKSDEDINLVSNYPYKHGNKAKRLAPPSVIGFCLYQFRKVDEPAAYEFLDQVITGINLAADTAAYITREKLMDLSALHREQKIELLFRGFAAHRKNKPTRPGQIKVKWELPQL